MWWPVRRLFQLLMAGAGQDVPQHMAFIMDGNRRYADQAGVQLLEGHSSGYAKMVEVIKWCFELGVGHVSVYAFSIDNFRRNADEVAGLMQLAAEKLDALMKDDGALDWGAELRVLGDLSRAPLSVQAASARLMQSSAELCEGLPPNAPRRVVNVCFSYTSTEELGSALDRVRGGLSGCQLLPEDVDAALLHEAMHTGAPCIGGSPPVDLILRTSGEERLSDFLVWQSGGALLYWLPVLWPRLGFLDLLRAVRVWQDERPVLEALGKEAEDCRQRGGVSGELRRALMMRPQPQQLQEQEQRDQCQACYSCSSNGCGSSSNSSSSSSGGGCQSSDLSSGGAVLVRSGQVDANGSMESCTTSGSTTCSSNCTCSCGSTGGSREAAYGTGACVGPSAAASKPLPGHLSSLASLERASSASLSVISEDAPACAPHPSQHLRVEGFLRQLENRRQEWIGVTLAATAANKREAAGRSTAAAGRMGNFGMAALQAWKVVAPAS